MSSRLGYGASERYSDEYDSGRETGSRRQKMMGYLKAANEIRQNYQTQFSQKLQNSYADSGVDAPGAFPDYDISSSGEEEMLLFPSYARRHLVKSSGNTPEQNRPLPGTEEEIDRPRTPDDSGYWKEEWEKYEDSNAIIDVDVRGWLYTPQHGPMNRKQRLMVALARKLSDIPAPTLPADNPIQRHVAKREEEDVRREAQNIIDQGEHDADIVWKSNQTQTGNKNDNKNNSDMPKRVTSRTNSDVSDLNVNLMERLKPFMSNPSIDRPVTVFFYNDKQSQSRTTTTNESGHFNFRAALEFVPKYVRVLASESLSTTQEVKITEPVGVSLISDIDDTVKHTSIASGAKEVFWNTFVRNFDEMTIKGVREWYNKLADMGVGIHYVSNSPWQLYPQLKAYFHLAGLPSGSFHLKRYSGMLQGIFEPTAERKRMSLDRIMRDFPERKFILVGDSGEADLEVYTELVQQNPGKILGVFIRDVTTTEKKEFFDHSFGQRRPGLGQSRTPPPASRVSTDIVEKRPPLPPRTASSAQTINNGDLINFDEEFSSKIATDSSPNGSPAVKGPPTKPSKPRSLQTAVTTTPPDQEQQVIKRKALPPLPSKPASLSSTPNDSSSETDKKQAPPVPQRKQQHNETYTEAVKNLATEVYNNMPSTKDTIDSLGNLSLTNPTSSREASTPSTAAKRGVPPPVPPTRRSANSASTTTLDEKPNNKDIPPPQPPRPKLPPRQSSSSSISSPFPNSSSRRQQSVSESSLAYNNSSFSEPSSYQQPVLNKREELWKRRWERAQRILSDQGVLLGSWRVGSDVQDITVWIVENALKKEKNRDYAMKKEGTNGRSGGIGRLVDDE